MLYLKNKHVIARCRQFFVLEYLPNQWAVQTLGHRRLAETTPPVNFRHRKRQNPAKTGLRNVRDFRRCFSPAFRSAEATWTSTARFLQRNLGPIDIKTFWPELPVPYLSCSKGPWWVSTLINLHLIKQHYPVCVCVCTNLSIAINSVIENGAYLWAEHLIVEKEFLKNEVN